MKRLGFTTRRVPRRRASVPVSEGRAVPAGIAGAAHSPPRTAVELAAALPRRTNVLVLRRGALFAELPLPTAFVLLFLGLLPLEAPAARRASRFFPR